MQVGSKLQVVLLPRENQDGVLKKLKDCTYGGEGGREERGVGLAFSVWPSPSGILNGLVNCARRE